MVYIKGLKFRGFKSFRRAEASFPNSYVCLAGPNGSGKCVSKDTEILLSDGSVVQIGNLVEKELERSNDVTKMDDGAYSLQNPDGLEVLSLNPETLKMEKKRIDAFVRRKSPSKLYRIRTSSGREITATGYHPLIALKDAQVKALNAGELSTGTFIALPRSIQIEARDFSPFFALASLDLPIYIHNHEHVCRKLRIIKKASGLKVKELASLAGVPHESISSLFDGQSIKLHHAYNLLSHFNTPQSEIYSMLRRVKGRSKQITIPLVLDEQFAKFLGYIISEGRIQRNEIFFYNNSEGINRDYAKVVRGLFDCDVTCLKNNGKTFHIFPLPRQR